jgi:hypothetical protein
LSCALNGALNETSTVISKQQIILIFIPFFFVNKAAEESRAIHETNQTITLIRVISWIVHSFLFWAQSFFSMVAHVFRFLLQELKNACLLFME